MSFPYVVTARLTVNMLSTTLFDKVLPDNRRRAILTGYRRVDMSCAAFWRWSSALRYTESRYVCFMTGNRSSSQLNALRWRRSRTTPVCLGVCRCGIANRHHHRDFRAD